MRFIDFSIRCIHGLLAICWGALAIQHACSQDLVISEFMADNETFSPGPGRDYPDWLELANLTDSVVHLQDMFLSDDSADLRRHRIGPVSLAPGSRQVFWAHGKSAAHDQLQFKLSKHGGSIFLVGKDGKTIVSEVHYERQRADVSYVMTSSGWKYSDRPSPGADNPGVAFYNGFADPPAIHFEREANGVTASISGCPEGEIWFTRDGSSPFDPGASRYNGPFPPDSVGFIRAVCRKEGWLTVEENLKAFVDSSRHTLPVISLTTDPDNLWSEDIGLFVTGKHVNYAKRGDAWIRPGRISIMNLGPVSEYPVEFKIYGSGSRSLPKKSMQILAQPDMKNHFFDSFEHEELDGFVLRACHLNSTRYKNELVHGVNELVHSEVLMQDLRPVVLYINGQYWGLYNIMERKNNDFIERHYGVKPAHIVNCGKTRISAIRGSKEDYATLVDSLNALDMENPAAFRYICSVFDVESLADYWIHDLITNKLDYFNNRIWKAASDTSVWRWINYDFDICFVNPREIREAYTTKEATGVLIIGKLLQNQGFKKIFFRRLCDMLHFGYTQENLQEIIRQRNEAAGTEFAPDRIRWKPDGVNSDNAWSLELNILRQIRQRTEFLLSDFAAQHGFFQQVVISNPSPEKGRLTVNGYEVKNEVNYFTDAELRLEVFPAEGYRFAGWSDPKFETAPDDRYQLRERTALSPVFEPR